MATTTAFQTTVTAGGPTTEVPGLIYIHNGGGGILDWAIAVNYQSGSGWLLVGDSSGQNDATVGVWVRPQNLTAGVYTANLVVSGGGPLSNPVTIPVTVTVLARAAHRSAAGNGDLGNQRRQSAGRAPGARLSGDGHGHQPGGQGRLRHLRRHARHAAVHSATQINLQVPASLSPSKTSASMVVTVDGVSSTAFTVALAPAGPAIFNPGVLNQDNSLNAPASAAKAGTVLQIFATGIPAGALVSAQIGGQGGLTPVYAGPAPGLTGVQQVNVAVPGGLAPGAEPLVVCALASSQTFCSVSYTVFVQ